MEIFPEVTSIVNDLIYFSSLTVYHGNIIFHLIIFNGLPNVSSIVSTNVEARCTPYRMWHNKNDLRVEQEMLWSVSLAVLLITLLFTF